MNELDLERFQEALRQTAPAQPPADLMERLKALRPMPASSNHAPERRRLPASPIWRLRWLVPAAALVVGSILIWQIYQPNHNSRASVSSATTPALRADNVQINHELVDTFDTVARLPNGEPVRFRCRAWVDQVVLTDNTRGVTIEQRAPRLEIVPLRFETY